MEPVYRYGIELFNRREFYECHEVLEDLWRPTTGAGRFFLQSIIHIAVGFYHLQKQNPLGAERQLRKGLRKLAGYLPRYGELDTAALYGDAFLVYERVLRAEPVDDFPQISVLREPVQSVPQ